MKPLDPTVEQDLNTIDAALSEGRVTATLTEDRELQELALLLEADAERPDADFAAELADRVHEGFPRERKRRLPIPSLRFGRVQAFAGVAAAALLAVLVVVSVQNGSDDDPQLGSELSSVGKTPEKRSTRGDGAGAGGGVAKQAPAGAEPAPDGTVEALPLPGRRARDFAPGDFAPGKRERRIERSASLTLAAPGDELDRVAERVQTVTDRHGGFVLRSSITSGDEGGEGGTFELRIPADRLQPALRDLAALGEVRSRTQSGQDVTPAFVSAADRLQAARAERKSLLRRLENATTDTEAEALRQRLDLVAAEINGLRSRLHNLRIRTDYASVSLELVEDGDGGSSGGSGGSSSIDDALDDALDSLTDSIGIALRVLGVALPLALLAAAAWAGARILRRRRREAALG